MASRDIANMHVFLDLKKKFPDLPDETLRSYVPLYAEDQEKCLTLLQKENKNHYHPLPFPDFRLPENKVHVIRNDDAKHLVLNSNDDFPAVNLQQLYIPTNNKNISTTSGRSSSHAGIILSSRKPLKQNISTKAESVSAPVIANNERPFMYRQNSSSSQTTCPLPSYRNDQFIFQTTKNHVIEAPETHQSTTYVSVSGEPEQSRKHAVKLSITPSFPFHQQHISIFNNPVCTAAASHQSRLERHTTSVNFQLQPQTSSQFPIEISTIPTNLGQSCNSKDFCSHVQISVCDEGTTFTAVRLQHPNYSQTTELCPPSSQVLNSNSSFIPNQRIQLLDNAENTQSFKHPATVDLDQNQNCFVSKIQPNAQMSAIPSYKSPHYILAVKNQQIAQLDSILSELEKQKLICSQLRTEVNRLEEKILKGNSTISSPSAEELQKLKEEIKKMRVEVSCLTMEIYSLNENSLGVKSESNQKDGQNKPPEDEDEQNQWLCENCTFANHPALEKCEMCELPKNSGSFFAVK